MKVDRRASGLTNVPEPWSPVTAVRTVSFSLRWTTPPPHRSTKSCTELCLPFRFLDSFLLGGGVNPSTSSGPSSLDEETLSFCWVVLTRSGLWVRTCTSGISFSVFAVLAERTGRVASGIAYFGFVGDDAGREGSRSAATACVTACCGDCISVELGSTIEERFFVNSRSIGVSAHVDSDFTGAAVAPLSSPVSQSLGSGKRGLVTATGEV